MKTLSDPASSASQDTEPFQERVAVLAEELELAIRWQRPSILIAVYESEHVRSEAEALLTGRLSELGQRVHRLQLSSEQPEVTRLLEQVPEREATVFFVSGLKWGGGRGGYEAYRALNLHREYFVETQIRAVFWLTRTEAVDLPKHAPDFWAFRHRVIEFVDLPVQRRGAASVERLVWAGVEGEEESLADLEGRIALREALLAELPEGEESQAARVDLFYALAHLYWEKGEYQRSLGQLQAGLAIADRLQDTVLQARFWTGLGIVQVSLEHTQKARSAYEQALQLRPREAVAWTDLAALYRALGQTESAIQACRQAIELDPAEAAPWNNLGNIYRDLGRLEEAKQAYRKALQLSAGDSGIWLNLGRVCSDQDRPRDAIRALRKAARLAPGSVEPWKVLGGVYQRLDRPREAIKAYRTALALEPDDENLRASLAECTRRVGRP